MTLSFQVVLIPLAYQTVLVAFPGRSVRGFISSGFVAFIPSFSDMMSGINLDAPAALLGALIALLFIRCVRYSGGNSLRIVVNR